MEEIPLSLKAYRLVLLKPPFGVSTPEAYAGITPHAAAFDLRYLKDSELENWKEYVRNDFEATVFAKYPYLAEVKQYLYGLGAVYVSMTGSGSAIYALFPRDSKVKIECPDCFVWQED